MTVLGAWWLDKHAGSVSAVLTCVLVLTTVVYVAFTYRLARAASDERADRRWLQLTEQARQVGGYLGVDGYGMGREKCRLEATIVNASSLPVRGVQASAYNAETGEHVEDFKWVPVLTPGEAKVRIEIPDELGLKVLLRLEFDDDAGMRWLKYDSPERPLLRVG